MRFYVGVTDNAWFEYLRQLGPDEVNFRRPSGKEFSALEAGAPFLFKLHSPLNYIVGGGFFIRSETLPLSLAWEVFGEKNGAANPGEFERLIRNYRGHDEPDPEIGCVILNQPFFIPREHWLPAPGNWRPNIVSGKTYDDQEEWSRQTGALVRCWLPHPESSDSVIPAVGEQEMLYGQEYLRRSRLGQGAFRILVTDAYQKRCAISGERTLAERLTAPIIVVFPIITIGWEWNADFFTCNSRVHSTVILHPGNTHRSGRAPQHPRMRPQDCPERWNG
jgi:putative restriction endonuclease